MARNGDMGHLQWQGLANTVMDQKRTSWYQPKQHVQLHVEFRKSAPPVLEPSRDYVSGQTKTIPEILYAKAPLKTQLVRTNSEALISRWLLKQDSRCSASPHPDTV
jgi:hypothetical protein